MYTLYTWRTPNGYKVPILLEELGAEYELQAVNLDAKEQKAPDYVKINPNGKIPALVDGDAGVSVFESGAILMYLAEKHLLLPTDTKSKYAVIEWLFFQMSEVGPFFGQANHFVVFAKEKIPYAIERYQSEVRRICTVMEKHLGETDYLAGEYSIADIATWPWVRSAVSRGHIDIHDYPNLKRWYEAIGGRPAVQAAIDKVDAAAKEKELTG